MQIQKNVTTNARLNRINATKVAGQTPFARINAIKAITIALEPAFLKSNFFLHRVFTGSSGGRVQLSEPVAVLVAILIPMKRFLECSLQKTGCKFNYIE